mmetsp:Transcript_23241/g.64992  ORF Transcript_23241/g.64992 Transcript_23241/m.64992 type:complete len:355 (+) Transcript_23241:838-1902(+)
MPHAGDPGGAAGPAGAGDRPGRPLRHDAQGRRVHLLRPRLRHLRHQRPVLRRGEQVPGEQQDKLRHRHAHAAYAHQPPRRVRPVEARDHPAHREAGLHALHLGHALGDPRRPHLHPLGGLRVQARGAPEVEVLPRGAAPGLVRGRGGPGGGAGEVRGRAAHGPLRLRLPPEHRGARLPAGRGGAGPEVPERGVVLLAHLREGGRGPGHQDRHRRQAGLLLRAGGGRLRRDAQGGPAGREGQGVRCRRGGHLQRQLRPGRPGGGEGGHGQRRPHGRAGQGPRRHEAAGLPRARVRQARAPRPGGGGGPAPVHHEHLPAHQQPPAPGRQARAPALHDDADLQRAEEDARHPPRLEL